MSNRTEGSVRAGRRAGGRRLSTHAATAGLVAVLLVLTVFSVVAAVANARAAQKAEQSAAVSEWSEEAEQRLLQMEDLADELALAPDDELRAEYEATRAATRHALEELGVVEGTGHEQRVAGWLQRLDSYGAAVDALIAAAAENPAIAEAFEEEFVDPYYDALETVVKGEAREHWADASRSLDAMGDSQRLLVVATPVVFGLGLGLVGWFTAVLTRSRRATVAQAERNRQQALHDALTGLPNRTLLRQRGDAALEALAPGTAPAALMLIDLDRFKEINDTLGHAYGDLVLQAVATRLRETLRSTDTVARLGGDEFAILLPSVDGPEAALDLAARALAAMEAPIDADGVSLDVDASIGIALSGVHGTDVQTLLQSADIAMYSAKDRGLGVCVYDDGLNVHSPERLGLLGELRRAIDGRELVLHFQPKATLSGEEVCGVEALVRWQHPERGLVAPAEFIPLAERTPLIRPLTRYVVDAALAQCARWRTTGRTLRVAVNISARNLLDERFVDDVLELLARHDVPAWFLELEVTESAIMADPARARAILTRLAEVGVTLSIDDFGAGYTSLAHLKDLPVHQLKVDRSLVTDVTVHRSNALIVRSVVELARNLGLTTVAEGVEDRETWDLLARLGCDVAQGHLLCRPMPAELLEAWFDRARVGV
ncbi:putative bifunctional diguanylate cyclase/phosphodiesterase [Geodermatophilus sabuli]|uniref:Diguanylate cyclase (GGDEF) domain-containing protein n=1 Tax=Geodermatophilus sabuli TaxID=1564158 RepID=A0A285E5L1_9ACTN|nr:EAL domain-containing protein [Geodermatophilus sabuli]MBB3082772.1 diguanylate cyclase (GGDEF)-like protein [Geodermatophilus sabuli]SNX94362.1 diguanylate cyclase (GGDEF) domain-containing protein [Geodermatophilus sabuli]